jgi:hypothetical protein
MRNHSTGNINASKEKLVIKTPESSVECQIPDDLKLAYSFKIENIKNESKSNLTTPEQRNSAECAG